MPETSRVPDPDLYPVPADWADKAHLNRETYEAARIAAQTAKRAASTIATAISLAGLVLTAIALFFGRG